MALQKLSPFVFGATDHENHYNPLYFYILLVSFIALSIKLKISNKKSKKQLMKLPPSPPRLPIVGNLHQLSTLPHISLAALSSKYGPLMFLQLGKVPTLVISSAEMAREMMKTHDISFCNRPQLLAGEILLYGCKDFGFSPYGEYWRQARKICVLELLSTRRVQMFHYVREEETQLLTERLQRACLDGLSVNLSDLLMSTSNNILSRCILGEKFEDENGESKYGKQARKFLEQLAAFCFADFFPFLVWIDHLRGYIKELEKTFKEFDGLGEKLIEEHKMKLGSNQDVQSEKKDIMDILIELQKDGNVGFELTDEHIKAIILDMLIAGTDPSATALEWAMAELVRNPTKMKKAREDIRRVVGNKTKIDMNDLNEMNYLDCVMKESLRLHPPAPLLVPRETSTDILNMGGYDIPAKTRVQVNVYAIHRDPNLWENPNDFIPERFINNSKDFRGRDDFQFLPFGGGRRGCPGSTFGLIVVKYVMANLLYWFDWEMPDENLVAEELNMDESPGLSVSKKVPLHLKPKPYHLP